MIESIHYLYDSILFSFLVMKYIINPLDNFLFGLLHCVEDPEILIRICQFCVDYSVDKRVLNLCRSILFDRLPNEIDVWKAFCKCSLKCLNALLGDNWIRELDCTGLENHACYMRFFILTESISNLFPI